MKKILLVLLLGVLVLSGCSSYNPEILNDYESLKYSFIKASKEDWEPIGLSNGYSYISDFVHDGSYDSENIFRVFKDKELVYEYMGNYSFSVSNHIIKNDVLYLSLNSIYSSTNTFISKYEIVMLTSENTLETIYEAKTNEHFDIVCFRDNDIIVNHKENGAQDDNFLVIDYEGNVIDSIVFPNNDLFFYNLYAFKNRLFIYASSGNNTAYYEYKNEQLVSMIDVSDMSTDEPTFNDDGISFLYRKKDDYTTNIMLFNGKSSIELFSVLNYTNNELSTRLEYLKRYNDDVFLAYSITPDKAMSIYRRCVVLYYNNQTKEVKKIYKNINLGTIKYRDNHFYLGNYNNGVSNGTSNGTFYDIDFSKISKS